MFQRWVKKFGSNFFTALIDLPDLFSLCHYKVVQGVSNELKKRDKKFRVEKIQGKENSVIYFTHCPQSVYGLRVTSRRLHFFF